MSEINGVEGLSVDEVRMRVNQGGRFVIFTWTLSFIVMTVRRPAAVTFINPGESAALKSMPYTLISFFFGWWGIPWGFIYTPMSIIENLGGGRDVTNEIMATLGGGASSAPPLRGEPQPPYASNPGTAFGGQPGSMRPTPLLSDQLGVENDAKLGMYLGFAGILCMPVGLAGAFFGVRAIGRARSLGMSTPGSAVVGIVLGATTSLCIGASLLMGILIPREPKDVPPIVSAPVAPAPVDTSPPEKEDVSVQPGGGQAAHFRLHITKVHEQQKPSPKPPFHEPGGDWTFLDLDAGEGVELTAGFQFKKSAEMFSFGKAQLSVPGKQAGEAFTSAFDAKFHGTAGKLQKHAGPLSMSIAVLGTDMVRERSGGFRSGRFGTWTATKLFPAIGERQGEVFFNYSIEDGLAEFSEKDADYADDLAFVFGSAFTTGK